MHDKESIISFLTELKDTGNRMSRFPYLWHVMDKNKKTGVTSVVRTFLLEREALNFIEYNSSDYDLSDNAYVYLACVVSSSKTEAFFYALYDYFEVEHPDNAAARRYDEREQEHDKLVIESTENYSKKEK